MCHKHLSHQVMVQGLITPNFIDSPVRASQRDGCPQECAVSDRQRGSNRMEALEHQVEPCPQASRAGSSLKTLLKKPGRALPAPVAPTQCLKFPHW